MIDTATLRTYIISRTSAYGMPDDEESEPPCQEAFPLVRQHWDRRTFKSEAEHDARFPGEPWRSLGSEHQANPTGGIMRRLADTRVWAVKAQNVEELVQRYGRLVVSEPWSGPEEESLLKVEITMATGSDVDTATLTKLIELGEKATERPWAVYEQHNGYSIMGSLSGQDGTTLARLWYPEEPETASNATFIAASANLAVPLAREVMRLREENERMRAKCADIEAHHISNLADQVRVLKAEVERLRKKAGLAEETQAIMADLLAVSRKSANVDEHDQMVEDAAEELLRRYEEANHDG